MVACLPVAALAQPDKRESRTCCLSVQGERFDPYPDVGDPAPVKPERGMESS